MICASRVLSSTYIHTYVLTYLPLLVCKGLSEIGMYLKGVSH